MNTFIKLFLANVKNPTVWNLGKVNNMPSQGYEKVNNLANWSGIYIECLDIKFVALVDDMDLRA